MNTSTTTSTSFVGRGSGAAGSVIQSTIVAPPHEHDFIDKRPERGGGTLEELNAHWYGGAGP